MDGIADSDIFLARNRLVTVGSIDGGGADNGSLHGNGLVNVVDILVVGNLDTVRGKGLEGDELGAGLDAAALKVKVTVAVPLSASAVNSAVAVTGLPSASTKAFLVDLSIRVPVSV